MIEDTSLFLEYYDYKYVLNFCIPYWGHFYCREVEQPQNKYNKKHKNHSKQRNQLNSQKKKTNYQKKKRKNKKKNKKEMGKTHRNKNLQ